MLLQTLIEVELLLVSNFLKGEFLLSSSFCTTRFVDSSLERVTSCRRRAICSWVFSCAIVSFSMSSLTLDVIVLQY